MQTVLFAEKSQSGITTNGERAKQASPRIGSSRLRACARASLFVLGFAAVNWAGLSLPQFSSAVPAKEVMSRIIADDRFREGALMNALASMQASLEPIVLRDDLPRAEALIRLRIAEETTGRRDPVEADAEVANADEKVKFALALNPADSFLWMILYSLEMARNGFEDKTIGFLDQSYGTGPLEAWIALRRNRLALAAFASLSGTLQEQVVAEFAALVDSEFTEAAALNLSGIGWAHRDRLVAGLGSVDIASKERLAKLLSTNGTLLPIPGIEVVARPWFR